MKQIIKTLALSLVVSLGLVACNDNEDFDNYKVNYPSEVPTGFYESGYTIDNDFEYSVLLQNNKGYKICQIFRTKKSNGTQATVMSDTIKLYNDTLGIFSATSAAEDNYLEAEITANFIIKQNNELLLQMSVGGASEAAVSLHKTNGIPTVVSIWSDMEKAVATELTPDSIKGSENPLIEDQLLGILVAGGNQYIFGYKFENGKGEFTTEDGKKGTLAYNDKYQLVITFENETYVCNRNYTTPAPEVFNPIAKGTFHYGLQSLTEDNFILFDESMNHESVLGQSAEDPNRFCIQPWLGNQNGLVVVLDPATGNVTVPKQFTGFADQELGQIFAEDIAHALGMPDMAATFDGKAFVLPIAYTVAKGAVCFQVDAFAVEEMVEQPQSVATFSTVKSKSVESAKKFVKVNKLAKFKK